MNYAYNSTQRYSDVDVLSTEGRIGRKRYFLYSTILPLLVFWAISAIAALATYLPVANDLMFYSIMGVAACAAIYMMVYLTIQRCHDFNRSGAWAVFALIPFANIIFSLIRGTNGLNSYGEVPIPATWFFKTLFYALIVGLIALVAYVVTTQLPQLQLLLDQLSQLLPL